jgi:hypothetical protein
MSGREMRDVLVTQGSDRRALFFAALFFDERHLLLRSAEEGYAPAQALMPCRTRVDAARVVWSQKSAAQNDRNGLHRFAICFEDGIGCEADQGIALDLYRRAAELGQPDAQFEYALKAYEASDVERYVWLGRAAGKGYHNAIIKLAEAAVEQNRPGRILFEIGAGLSRVSVAQRTSRTYHDFWSDMDRSINLFNTCVARAKAAIECWVLVARRLQVVKDMRNAVCKMLWTEKAWSEF